MSNNNNTKFYKKSLNTLSSNCSIDSKHTSIGFRISRCRMINLPQSAKTSNTKQIGRVAKIGQN